MPYVTNYILRPNSEIVTGIEKVGARVWPDKYNIPQRYNLQPYNRSENTIESSADIRLRITVSRDPDYTDYEEYTTSYVEKGETVVIEHAFLEAGTYYIKLVAESRNGYSSNPYEYTIQVIIIKYFLEEPEVQTEGPKANSIIVKSPTAEYTATTDPAPNADELIERLVEIDEGDTETCQIIAEALVNRWSGEQKSVTGNIDLTVTLKFKEKIRVVNNSIGLDEEMILQKKEHDVTGRITTITCGDIILSDDELLARIIDEIGA